METEKDKSELSELCYLIGCSGVDTTCPGNPKCEILIKLIKASNAASLLSYPCDADEKQKT